MFNISEINLNEMISQVKGVLPNVPLDLIRHDLIITKNVDLTISRILEGSINYIPELKHLYSLSQGSEKFQKTKCLCDAVAKDLPIHSSPSTNATTDAFKKSSKDRIKLYEERKAQLIKNARMSYINKHCVFNVK
ncbi:ancient ubiquitous protein 1-like [Centruroides sculpturatus]|uniref:ancient ubiquitous protein 1-like n=1 Tax=Centruroides sculpturatus TaxID=218467 RepID=UPI000C6DFC5E|nr:ancient ubiquitous protein 1-like [Centruroides sculpturatus]